jgi:hypothetical protein
MPVKQMLGTRLRRAKKIMEFKMSDWKNEMVECLFPVNPKDLRIEIGQEIKYKNMPERLFKFCRFDKDGYYINNLKNYTVWLSSPNKLNDPYDCAMTYSNQQLFEKIFDKNIRKVISDMQANGISFSEEEINLIENSSDVHRKLVEIVVSKEPTIKENERENITNVMLTVLKEQLDKMPIALADASKETTVLTSFSERNDSIIMWSHYAANHTGFCLEYNFKQFGPKNKTNILLYPVIYKNELTDITKYLLSIDEQVFTNTITVLAAITKSLEWEYEKEWRLLIPFNISKTEKEWDSPKPTAIYMGSKIEENNQIILTDIAKQRNIPLFKAGIKQDKFELVFNEISIA